MNNYELNAARLAQRQEQMRQENLSKQAQQNDNLSEDTKLNFQNGNEFSMKQAQQTLEMAQNQSADENLPQNYFKSTNVKYLDDKIKNNQATLYDAYIAKKYLGLDLSEYGDKTADLNINAKVKGLGMTTSHDKMYSDVDDSLAIDRTIMSSEGNLGVGAGLGRWIHKATGGLVDTSQGEFIANTEMAAKALARTNGGGGRITNQQAKDAAEIVNPKFKDKENYLRHLLGVKKSMASTQEQTIRNNILKGATIPDAVLQNYKGNLDRIAYMEQALEKGKFDYKKFASLMGDNNAHNVGKKDFGKSMGTGNLRIIERKNEKK